MLIPNIQLFFAGRTTNCQTIASRRCVLLILGNGILNGGHAKIVGTIHLGAINLVWNGRM